MLRISLLALALAGTMQQSYEPPKLQGGMIKSQRIMTTTAGMVLLDLTVSERGLVTNTRVIKDVPPYGDLTKASISSWRFEPGRLNRVATDSRILVVGLYRPPSVLFPVPATPTAPPPDSDDEIPFPIEIVVPPYPPNRIGSANVLVEVDVDERGSVTSAVTLTQETGFDDAAESTARGWKFRPAMEGRNPVRSRVYMIVSFRQPGG